MIFTFWGFLHGGSSASSRIFTLRLGLMPVFMIIFYDPEGFPSVSARLDVHFLPKSFLKKLKTEAKTAQFSWVLVTSC